jgi:hypothetical protein
MEGSFINREKRRYPRVFIDFPLKYQDKGDSCLRGAIVVNAGEGGFLIETVRSIPVGTELSMAVLFLKRFELTKLKVLAKIVRKGPYRKEDWKGFQYWEGYRYGLEITQILEEDRRKLSLLLGGRFQI